jgi:low affinity Fe/Cu permease
MPPKLADESWHLDKKVPVAIIVVLVGQFLLGLWFIAKLDSKVEEQAARLAKTEAQVNVIDREAREFGNRIVRIEEKTSSMLTILQRLERVLDGRRTETP